MRESRTRHVSGRRFSAADLLRIAAVFETADVEAPGSASQSATFLVKASDGTVYESDTSLLFADGSDAMLKRPVFIQMSRIDYRSGREIHFSATHGGSLGDYVRVKGEPEWARQVFTTLTEKVDAAPSTQEWITSHPMLVRLIVTLGLGALVDLVIRGSVPIILPMPSPELVASLRSSAVLKAVAAVLLHPVGDFVWTWGVRWLMGNGLWAALGTWFFAAYPDIDLDLGPEHLKREKIQRARIAFLGGAVAIPLAVAIVYDVLRWLAAA